MALLPAWALLLEGSCHLTPDSCQFCTGTQTLKEVYCNVNDSPLLPACFSSGGEGAGHAIWPAWALCWGWALCGQAHVSLSWPLTPGPPLGGFHSHLY